MSTIDTSLHQMARTLDSQVTRDLPIPPPHFSSGSPNPTPGFMNPPLSTTPAPMPPQGSSWSPWKIPQSGSPSDLSLQLPPSSNLAQQSQIHQAEHSPLQPLPYPGPPSPTDHLGSAM